MIQAQSPVNQEPNAKRAKVEPVMCYKTRLITKCRVCSFLKPDGARFTPHCVNTIRAGIEKDFGIDGIKKATEVAQLCKYAKDKGLQKVIDALHNSRDYNAFLRDSTSRTLQEFFAVPEDVIETVSRMSQNAMSVASGAQEPSGDSAWVPIIPISCDESSDSASVPITPISCDESSDSSFDPQDPSSKCDEWDEDILSL